jgi:hypothetical protein
MLIFSNLLLVRRYLGLNLFGSLLLWRILHNKIPTDDCLKLEVAICGGILRDHEALHLGCFAVNIGISTALSSELNGVMFSIEIAFFKGWKTL